MSVLVFFRLRKRPECLLFKKKHLDVCFSRGKVACILGIIFIPLFGGLDYFIARPHFKEFILLRFAVTLFPAAILASFHLLQKSSKRHVNSLVAAYFTAAGFSIAYMCEVLGGVASSYYAGINLVILAMTVTMPWPGWYTIGASLVMVLFYLWRIFEVGVDLPRGEILINNLYFMLSTVTISSLSSFLQYRMYYLLYERDQAKSNFLSVVSHELKTPMTLIATPLEQALSRSSGEKIELAATEAESVRRNVYRLSTLVGDLIEIAKGEVGKSQLVPSDVPDVKKHFSDLFDGMKPLFDEKGIELRLETATLEPHFFDIKKVDKVFYNLLGNALKFTSKGGKVMVKVWDIPTSPPLKLRGGREGIRGGEGGIFNLSVSDSGIGIPKDKLARIFERFVQVEEGATRSYEGMGIGLSLVKDFVEQHGGTVTVESEVGKGSRFTVSLPRGKEYFRAVMIETKGEEKPDRFRVIPTFDPVRAVIPATEPSRTSGRRTILVVEDNPDLRASIVKILQEDYRIVAASDGREGLEKALESRPDLILTDIMMPVMDGYRMIQKIRKEEKFKDLPVIVLTAKSGEEGLAEGFEAGANDYLTKPFSSRELILRIRNQIAMQELKIEIIRQRNLASVGLLSAGISHNMNTYAAAVDASLRLAKNYLQKIDAADADKKEVERKLHDTKEALQSIKDMIVALEVYSQKNVEGFREEDITETTKAVIDLALTEIPHNVKIDYDAPRTLSCYFNPHILNPAVMNLITNAADACKDKSDGHVFVSLSNGSDGVLLAVQDNGGGIMPEIRDRIFDPYFTTKDVGEGSGLGLFMVWRAVEVDHGGKVWFETGNRGTTFYVRLPKKGGGHDQQREKNTLH